MFDSLPTVDEYLSAVTQAEGLEDKANVATALYECLLEKYESGDRAGELTRTGLNKLTPYNKAIKSLELRDGNSFQFKKADGSIQLRHVHFRETTCKQDYGKINAAFQQDIESRIENPCTVDVARYMESMIDALRSENDYEVSAGLIAATGRREIEIWRTGEFSTIKGENYKVLFKGQAKRKDYGLPKEEKPSYPISILIPASEFLKIWRAFKKCPIYTEVQQVLKQAESEKVKGESANDKAARLNGLFHSLRGRSVNRAVKNVYPANIFTGLESIKEGKESGAYVLRHATTNIAVQRDCTTKTPGAMMMAAAKQLGHFIEGQDKLADVMTSLGYVNFEVKGEIPDLTDAFKISTVQVAATDKEAFLALAGKTTAGNQRQAFHWLLGQGERARDAEQELAQAKREIERLQLKLGAALEAPAEAQQSEQPAPVATPNTRLDLGAEEDVREAFWGIVDHNEKQVETKPKWYIGARSLRDLSGKNHAVVKRWLTAHQTEIDDHNERHGLNMYHNRSHGRAGLVITDVIPVGKVLAA